MEGEILASGIFSEGHYNMPPKSYQTWLRHLVSVGDAKCQAMAQVIESEHHKQPSALISNRQAAMSTLQYVAGVGPPRSEIERRLKRGFKGGREIGALSVCSHIGISGNEKGDCYAGLEGIRGTKEGRDLIVTLEGTRERKKE